MNSELQKKGYEGMLRIRMVEEAIAERYPEQEMRCPVHLSIGQEAVATGVSLAVKPSDYAMSGHRAHAHYLAKGGDLNAFIAELYGKATGCCGGIGGSMHVIDLSCGFIGATPIVGSTVPIAVGTALTSKMKGEDRITVAYFGDGTIEEGVVHEAVAYATLKKLPVLFVCENNFFSVYSPLHVRQREGQKIHELMRGHGLKTEHGDGNNLQEVYRIASEAVERIRQGNGPEFLEYTTYRWLEHCGPYYDNDIGYRTEEEFLEWKEKDPVKRTEAELTAAGALDAGAVAKLREEIDADIKAAFDFAIKSPFPDKELLAANIYAP